MLFRSKDLCELLLVDVAASLSDLTLKSVYLLYVPSLFRVLLGLLVSLNCLVELLVF